MEKATSRILSEMEFANLLEQKAEEGDMSLSKFMSWQLFHQEKACVLMEDHLGDLNGSVAELYKQMIEMQKEMAAVKGNQCRLISRIYNCLPPWGQIIAFVIVGSLLADLGFHIAMH